MTEYIDKASVYEKIAELEELARKRYLDTPCDSPCYQRYLAQMQERTALKHLIADTTAADVAPVVRCRDCKWYDRKVWCPVAMSGFHEVGMPLPHEDDYCSFGERKEGDDER